MPAIPFSFEALMLCACAVCTSVWCDRLMAARNPISATAYILLIVACFIATIIHGVRWLMLM